ncbi:hypothetical protein [Mesorhizobium sp.]|nr:hypothetical protein [Mesorhizobium sp.]
MAATDVGDVSLMISEGVNGFIAPALDRDTVPLRRNEETPTARRK